jgi:hypothetical protein
MRIAGAFLLLGGFLLCISIVWAAVGFLMMGFGLICLLIAERRKKLSKALPDPLSREVDCRREPPPLQTETPAQPAPLVEAPPSRIDSEPAPSSFPEPRRPRPPRPPKPALISRQQPARRQSEPDTNPYDLEKWRALVKSDADISRSVEAVLPFGKKYVDQLAVAYLAFEEKSYLPSIVKLVANAIKRDSGRDSTNAAAIDGDPNTDLISFAISKARTSVAEPVFASPALDFGITEKSSAMSKAPPQIEPDTKPAAVQSELKTSRSLPGGGAGGTKQQPGAEGNTKGVDKEVDKGLAVRAVEPGRKATESVDDSQDLTNLLNRIA